MTSIFTDQGQTIAWATASWSQRLKLGALWAIAWGVVLPLMVVAGICFIGLLIDGFAERSETHDRCLKQATNGYEIRQCR